MVKDWTPSISLYHSSQHRIPAHAKVNTSGEGPVKRCTTRLSNRQTHQLNSSPLNIHFIYLSLLLQNLQNIIPALLHLFLVTRNLPHPIIRQSLLSLNPSTKQLTDITHHDAKIAHDSLSQVQLHSQASYPPQISIPSHNHHSYNTHLAPSSADLAVTICHHPNAT